MADPAAGSPPHTFIAAFRTESDPAFLTAITLSLRFDLVSASASEHACTDSGKDTSVAMELEQSKPSNTIHNPAVTKSGSYKLPQPSSGNQQQARRISASPAKQKPKKPVRKPQPPFPASKIKSEMSPSEPSSASLPPSSKTNGESLVQQDKVLREQDTNATRNLRAQGASLPCSAHASRGIVCWRRRMNRCPCRL